MYIYSHTSLHVYSKEWNPFLYVYIYIHTYIYIHIHIKIHRPDWEVVAQGLSFALCVAVRFPSYKRK